MQGRRHVTALGLSSLAAALTAGLLMIAVADWAGAAEVTANMAEFSFTPPSLTIQVGDTVRWQNTGRVPHTTTSDTGVWDSGTLSPGGSFSRQFMTPGTYTYMCRFHQAQGMRGTITVSAPSPTSPPAPAPTAPVVPPPPPPATAIPTPPAPPVAAELWLSILEPTPVYSDAGEVLWVAEPGEWYRVLSQDAGWALVVWENDPAELAVWIELDGRVQLSG